MTPPSTAVSPDARGIWHSARGPIALAALIVAVGVTIALLSASGESGALDPRSAEPSGSRALAELLKDQGVAVELVRTVAQTHAALDAAGAGGNPDDVPVTLLLTGSDLLDAERLTALSSRVRATVLIGPAERTARTLVTGTKVTDEDAEVREREPECDLDPVAAVGSASVGGRSYRSSSAQGRCYPNGDGFALLQLRRANTITLLGTGHPLTNEALDEHGNAALAMRLLGTQERLLWFVPSPGDVALGAGEDSLFDLLPTGWRFALVQAGIAVLLLALWRARRLGPLVREPLPVLVHAAETTEGRARLYRSSGAADHAAAALRRGAVGRITARLGLPTDAEPDAVAASAAAHTSRPAAHVRELLYGPPPRDDAALVRLADDLDVLENEVRTR